MAFCNSCGATLDPSTKFCKKCGAPNVAQVSAPAPVPVAASAAGPAGSGQSSGALRVILIVAAVIVAVGILGMATLGIITWRIAKSSHVRQEGDHVKVETPFGTVESTKDPEAAVRNLGVELYPGAQVLKSGAASATFGGVHTASASFETGDSVGKVASYYKAKFPNAMVTTSDQNHCTIVSNQSKNLITINIHATGDRTQIQIANITHKSESAAFPSN
jgi:Tfp pilus assembly protein PilV